VQPILLRQRAANIRIIRGSGTASIANELAVSAAIPPRLVQSFESPNGSLQNEAAHVLTILAMMRSLPAHPFPLTERLCQANLAAGLWLDLGVATCTAFSNSRMKDADSGVGAFASFQIACARRKAVVPAVQGFSTAASPSVSNSRQACSSVEGRGFIPATKTRAKRATFALPLSQQPFRFAIHVPVHNPLDEHFERTDTDSNHVTLAPKTERNVGNAATLDWIAELRTRIRFHT